ncbi:uncharacterized protein ACA1_389570 [Acanthamoeba castellanii str. Neff]|uniref:Uncharacterized protein n=1 Tax=Acanthamoeba castellanii (strain ATCC 30010 / Neff) TaxID=1257118 RepID=L8GGB8_ACACF|nr:uncharacterized protein ACA1_389570 [Acanthamoeba castellanii str. Neff]ELR11236.1 hypothetical protein ACA1_389570 [Acanthamoeba castellanii str. Neff]
MCSLSYFYLRPRGEATFIINLILLLSTGRFEPPLRRLLHGRLAAPSRRVFGLLQLYCFINWLRSFLLPDSFRIIFSQICALFQTGSIPVQALD